jgi:hypothetical protein
MSETQTMTILLRSHPCIHGLPHPVLIDRGAQAMRNCEEDKALGDNEPIVIEEP